jgi:hypothetical protein
MGCRLDAFLEEDELLVGVVVELGLPVKNGGKEPL